MNIEEDGLSIMPFLSEVKAASPKSEVIVPKYFEPIGNVVVRAISEFLGRATSKQLPITDLHFYVRLAAAENVRYVHYVGCNKRVTESNLSQQVNMKETNVHYMEDVWQNHPEVISAIGPLSFRLRLARKYFKLAAIICRIRHQT